jgi:hypothetical protein
MYPGLTTQFGELCLLWLLEWLFILGERIGSESGIMLNRMQNNFFYPIGITLKLPNFELDLYSQLRI